MKGKLLKDIECFAKFFPQGTEVHIVSVEKDSVLFKPKETSQYSVMTKPENIEVIK